MQSIYPSHYLSHILFYLYANNICITTSNFKLHPVSFKSPQMVKVDVSLQMLLF